MEELLRLSHISASSGDGGYLRDFNMTVFSGEFVFLAGAYRSGKHLVAQILSGRLQPESGSLTIDQKPCFDYTEQSAIDLGFFYIDNVFPLANTLSIHENIFLLRKKGTKKFLYHQKTSIMETKDLLKEVSFPCDPSEKIYRLSTFQRLLVCIAKALSWNTRFLVMNLTYMDLSRNDLNHLTKILCAQKSRGMSCLVIDNTYNSLAALADSSVMISRGTDMKTIRNQVITRNLIDSYLLPVVPKTSIAPSDKQLTGSSIQLSLTSRSRTYTTWTPGKIIGIIDHASDLEESFHDYIGSFCEQNLAVFTNTTFEEASPPESFQFYWIPENSDRCLLENLSIADNLLMPRYPQVSGICGYIKEDLSLYCEKEFCSLLHLPSIPASIKELTQLQKRILSICRFAFPGTDALFIDSPFMNLDFGGQSYLYQILRSLSSRGIAVFISSRQMDILHHFCTDIVVCSQFRWIETVTRNPVMDSCP